MKPIMIADIIAHTARLTGVSIDEIKGPRRNREFVRSRMIVCYLAREITGKSFPEIGRMLGGRDHSTIIHGRAECINIMQRDPLFRAIVRQVRKLARRQKRPLVAHVRRKPLFVPVPRKRCYSRVAKVIDIIEAAEPPKDEDESFDEIDDLTKRVARYMAQPERDRWAA